MARICVEDAGLLSSSRTDFRLSGRTLGGVLVAVAFSLSFGTSLSRAATPENTATLLRQIIAVSQPSVSGGSKVLELDGGVLLRSGFSTNSEDIQTLERLCFPASHERASFEPLPGNVILLLNRAAEKVELGTLPLASAEKKAVETAVQYLYPKADDWFSFGSSDYEPSKEYAEFSKYRKEYEQVSRDLQSKRGPERFQLEAKLQRIERDWLVFGFRNEVESALRTVDRYSSFRPEGLLQSWREALKADTPTVASRLRSAFGAQQWVRIQKSIKANEVSPLTLRITSRRESKSIVLPRLTSLAFEYTIVPFAKDFIAHPFMQSDKWRLPDGMLISDGSSQQTSGEIVSQYTSGFLLVRNAEFVFEVSLTGVPSLSEASRAELGGLTVVERDSGALFQVEKYLAISGPLVVALISTPLPRVPKPATNLNW